MCIYKVVPRCRAPEVSGFFAWFAGNGKILIEKTNTDYMIMHNLLSRGW